MSSCIGCDRKMDLRAFAAYAIMSEGDFATLGIAPHVLGGGRFHAGGVCAECFRDPSHRVRSLKAHFSLPNDLQVMLGRAGTTGTIGA